MLFQSPATGSDRATKPHSRLRCGGTVALLGGLLALGAEARDPRDLPESIAPCASCHHRSPRDQVGEWLASPYSQIEGGLSCADCHGRRCRGMEGSGGDPGDRRSGEPVWRARSAVGLRVTLICSRNVVEAEVVVTNLGAGHALPTGPPDRALRLEVSTSGPEGRTLPSSLRPRLVPFETDVSRYRFTSPAGTPVRVVARLLVFSGDGSTREIARKSSFCSSSSNDEEVSP